MWPKSWNWRSFRNTTACPKVRSVPDGSMPSLTRSGRCSRCGRAQPLGEAVGGQDLRGAGGEDFVRLAQLGGQIAARRGPRKRGSRA